MSREANILPLIRTTLRRPRVTGDLVSRPWKLILVPTPVGCGKTTLGSSWPEASGRARARLSLDEDDDGPSPVLTHLSAAIHTMSLNAAGHALAIPQAAALSPISVPAWTLIDGPHPIEESVILPPDAYHRVQTKEGLPVVRRWVEVASVAPSSSTRS